MNNTFSALLDIHEKYDIQQNNSEELIAAAIKKEFLNSNEIFNVAEKNSISIRDFTSGTITDFPLTPIRQSNEFYIKKHTESQIPYFHGHKFYELIYVHRGKCLQKFKDISEICLTAGQCMLLAPGTVHLIEKCNSADIIFKLVIPCSYFDLTGKKILTDKLSESTIIFDTVSATAEFVILKLLREQSCKTKFNDIIMQSYLTILFTELLNSPKTDITIETILSEYFKNNLKTATLSEFATKQGYNANYTSRLIKTRTGKSFSELLSSYRINRARQLLSESDLTIEDVAYEVGYSSPSSLYKQFFSIFGMKPSEYRNLLK